jgi:bacterioferritin (cytochrome b1)
MNPATHPADRGARAPQVSVLNALLCSELAAVATYEQALNLFADRPVWNDLRSICQHHRSAVEVLHDQVVNLGGEPGRANVFDSASLPVGRPANSGITIDALRTQEEYRLAEIERVLECEQLPDECRFAIRAKVLPRCHEHIDVLAGIASAVSRKG